MDKAAAKLVLLAVIASFIVEGDTRRLPLPIQRNNNKRISCKDENGRNVDWFIVYKLPKTKTGLNGYEMAYFDSRSFLDLWTLLPKGINETKQNPIWNTLKPIYGPHADKNVAFVAYNDQLPDSHKTKKGHAKGILMAGKSEGRSKALDGTVWLQHSVPRFVTDVKKGYMYPDSGRENGQLLFCLSFPLRPAVEVIAHHLLVQSANVYQNNTPKWAKEFEEFWHVLHGKTMRGASHVAVNVLYTTARNYVLAVAKSPYWLKDVYSEEMIKRTNDSIDVQSWKNGAGGPLPKLCRKPYEVNDVDEIGVETTNKRKNTFVSREDHSKWYVARHNAFFCFSSLNRMASQFKRGGEVTCLMSKYLAALFRRSIVKRTTCGNSKAE